MVRKDLVKQRIEFRANITQRLSYLASIHATRIALRLPRMNLKHRAVFFIRAFSLLQ
jgi:hypothetical protein